MTILFNNGAFLIKANSTILFPFLSNFFYATLTNVLYSLFFSCILFLFDHFHVIILLTGDRVLLSNCAEAKHKKKPGKGSRSCLAFLWT
ncbi:MAG TPA: hypothetical protein DCK76_12870 [Desulfotomaculum sp.]|nr:MAG: hypothetical protein XD78_2134 [Desulfotomaculum sp. 46_296]HAG12222.1 hypothetical protein [Desulfotomaculum sp.]